MKQPSSMHQRFQAVRAAESPTTSAVAANPSIDQTLIELIHAPLVDGETRAAGHDRKEREIGTVFAALDATAAWQLHRRLANPQPGDPLAIAFARLIVERRNRLLAYLGDPRRRAALGAA